MSDSRSYYSHPRSLFGPLVLITIGVLALLVNMGIIHREAIWWWFASYWPLLLIIWGLTKLIEYFWARRVGQPAPGVGAGGVVLLIFLILFGMGASASRNVNWGDIGFDDDFGGGIFGTKYEFTENVSQPVQPGAAVKVLGLRGNIAVTPSADNQAHAFIHKYTRTGSQNEANQVNDSTRPKFELQGDTLVLEMVSGNFDRGRFDLDLQVPRNSPLFVTTQRGDVRVSQRDKDVDLETTHGDIFVEDTKGNASLRLRHGDLTVRNVAGNVTVDGTVGDSNVSDVGGTVIFSGSYTGDVQLSHIAKQLRFNSIKTSLQLAKLDGDLSMDRGDFRGNAITGPLRLDTQTKDIDLKNVSGDVHIDDTRGSIEVHTALPLGRVEISNRAGEINVGLPEKATFEVDAESDNGDIMTDFPLNVNNAGRNATANGKVGNGGPSVRLKTNRGTIQIRKNNSD